MISFYVNLMENLQENKGATISQIPQLFRILNALKQKGEDIFKSFGLASLHSYAPRI